MVFTKEIDTINAMRAGIYTTPASGLSARNSAAFTAAQKQVRTALDALYVAREALEKVQKVVESC